MLTLSKLTLNNFRLFQSVSVSLRGRGLVYLGGDNRDIPKANSNMAGKSTLLHGLTWCLFECDATGQRIASDAVRSVETACGVSATFREGKRLIYVSRQRTLTAGSQIVMQDGKHMWQGRPEDVQHRIDAIFGPKDLFLAAHVFGYDEGARPFSLQPDTTQKRLFDLLIGAEDLDRALEHAKARAKTLSDDILENNRKTNRVEGRLHQAKQHVSDVKQQHADNNADATNLVEREKALSQKLDTAMAALQHANDVRMRKHRLFVKTRKKLNVQLFNADIQVERAAQQLGGIVALQGAEQNTLTLLHDKNTDACLCPTCNKVLHAPEIAKLRTTASKQLAFLKTEQVSREQEIVALKAAQRKIRDRLQAEKDGEQQRLLDCQHKSHAVTLLEQDIARCAAERAQQNAADASEVIRARKACKALRKELKALRVEATLLQKRYADSSILVEAFGPKGIRAFRLETLTPFLNNVARAYSSMLYGDGTTVRYSTQTQNKNGDLRDAFSVTVVNDKTGERISTLSAGQATRRDVIHTLSMCAVAESLGKRTVNMLVFDEVFRTLDASGINAVMDVLRELSATTGLILVAEHNEELRAQFPAMLYVKRENGTATAEWR